MASKQNSTNRTCCRCHKTFDKRNFYKTNSPIYTDNGYMPVCKNCLYEIFESFLDKYDNDVNKALKRVCMCFDIYYNDRLSFISDSMDKEVILGNYMKRLNMVQYKNKTMDDSLNEGFEFIDKSADNSESKLPDRNNPDDAEEIRRIDIKRWGDGYEAEDYKVLNDHYKYLTDANPNYDSNQEIFIKDLCYTNMLKNKAVIKGNIDDYRKLSDGYIKTFKQAGLKTEQETVNADEFSIAVNVQTIEQYTPAEFYKDKSLYKDHDGIGEYFERFVLRPLRNLQHGSSDRDYEYYVKEEGDSDG